MTSTTRLSIKILQPEKKVIENFEKHTIRKVYILIFETSLKQSKTKSILSNVNPLQIYIIYPSAL